MDWVAGRQLQATGAGAGASKRLTRVGVNTGLGELSWWPF